MVLSLISPCVVGRRWCEHKTERPRARQGLCLEKVGPEHGEQQVWQDQGWDLPRDPAQCAPECWDFQGPTHHPLVESSFVSSILPLLGGRMDVS